MKRLQIEPFVAKFHFDTAENELSEVDRKKETKRKKRNSHDFLISDL